MDVSHPSRAIVPTLDGPVLTVLARTTRPLTVGEVHRLAGTGSENGVRKALGRLVKEGTVRADHRSTATYYEGNRDHLVWPAVEIIAGLRRTLLQRIRDELSGWDPRPLHASLFGSAARGDGDMASDIDILLIRPDDVAEDSDAWGNQVDQLRSNVEAWTGNYCQALQLGVDRLAAHLAANDEIVHEWQRDEITLAGGPLRTVVHQLPNGGTR